MTRRGDAHALLAIALGAVLGSMGTRALLRGRFADYEVRVERSATTVEATPIPACSAAFLLEAQPSHWAVVGSYNGTARLTPEGLAIEVYRGFTLAAERDAEVRGIVFGIAQPGLDGSWSVTHSADPIPVGALRKRVRQPVPPTRVLIPGVAASDLVEGWLVVEHVLDAPNAPGGTAWTYLHAPRSTLHPLLRTGCPL